MDNDDSSESYSVSIDTLESASTSVYSDFQEINNSINDEKDTPIKLYFLKAISSVMLNSINSFRTSHQKPLLNEDHNLFFLAMEHSNFMTKQKENFNTNMLYQKMGSYSFVCYEALISRRRSDNNAYYGVVNSWITDPSTMKSILTDYNVGAVGTAISSNNELFFTLILAVRTIIGNSYYISDYLKSMILAQRTIDLLNDYRTNRLSLQPIKMDLRLCELAYEFNSLDSQFVSFRIIKDKIGIYSSIKITLGSIPFDVKHPSKIQPELIVEEWINQLGKTTTFFGNFNRIGVGFKEHDGSLISLIFLIRSLQAAIVDGTETMIDESVIGQCILEKLSQYCEENGLPSLVIDEDLNNYAQMHAVYNANGQINDDPLKETYYIENVENDYEKIDVSHTVVTEISQAPFTFVSKWMKNQGSLSVIFSGVTDAGIGVTFDEDFRCHITLILAKKRGKTVNIVNKIVRF